MISCLGVLALVLRLALREYTLAGQAIVFSALISLAILTAFATRLTVTFNLLLSGLLLGIDLSDRVKYKLTNTHVNLFDVVMLWNMAVNRDFTVVSQYSRLATYLLLHLFLFIAAAGVLALWERRLVVRLGIGGMYRPVVVFAAFTAFLLQATILLNSRYLGAINGFHSFDTSSEPRGFRIGPAVAYAGRILRAQADLRADAGSDGPATGREKVSPGPESCATCPDLVIVESTFDPRIVADYSDRPGYLVNMAADSPLVAMSGDLLVNIFGGSSWISEFEVLCGIHHALFGDGGSFPHTFVAPFLTGCAPASLKAVGYSTSAIYTTHPFFAGVAAGFRNYGIDEFLSNRSIGAPDAWAEQRDSYFVDALTRILAQPSDRPRFIFVSTSSNHGPHGHHARDTHAGAGPFDPSITADEALADYINRLNDTYSTMLRLERELERRERPVAVLFYGDHQPAFVRDYSASVVRRYGRASNKVTLYRMARNYGGTAPAATDQTEIGLPIESLVASFLDFAGLPELDGFARARILQKEICPSSQLSCPPEIKRSLRKLLMAQRAGPR